MKKIYMFVGCVVFTTSLNAAVLSNRWQTNEIALLPKKPFGGYEPVLLISELPRTKPLPQGQSSSQWNVMKVSNFNGRLSWNPSTIKTVKGQDLFKIPTRKQFVAEEFCFEQNQLHVQKGKFITTVPFIQPE